MRSDASGLYAVTDICTHQGTIIQSKSASKSFYCPKHGSRFDFDGNVTVGPAVAPLDHYGVCVDGAGAATIDVGTVVDQETRT